MNDPYTTLNITKSASPDEVRTAFRKLAKKYHPDLNPGNKEAEKKFKEINTANEILSDSEKRAKFDNGEIDASGTSIHSQAAYQQSAGNEHPFYYDTQRRGGRYSSAGGFGSDMFEGLFKKQGFYTEEVLPRDERYLFEVDFRDAILGAEKEMQLPTGKTIKVHVPPGINSGEKLRLKGLANKSNKSTLSGDVYIEIKVNPSKIFTRNGMNLELEVPITFYEAMLGQEIRIPTLEKSIMLKIPQGSTTGSKLKIKGKGVGAKKETDRGDLIVILKIAMPSKVDAELEEAVGKWSKLNAYNPREQLDKDGGAL